MRDTKLQGLSENILQILLSQFCLAIQNDATLADKAATLRNQLMESQREVKRKLALAEKKFSLMKTALQPLKPYADANDKEIPLNPKIQLLEEASQAPGFIQGIIDRITLSVSDSLSEMMHSAKELFQSDDAHSSLITSVESIISQSTTGSVILQFCQHLEKICQDGQFSEDNLKDLCSINNLKNVFSEITSRDDEVKNITHQCIEMFSDVADAVQHYGTATTLLKVTGISMGIIATASGVVVMAILASAVYGGYHAIKHYENSLAP